MALVSIRVPDLPGVRFHRDGQTLIVGATLEIEDNPANASSLFIALTDELLSVKAQQGGFVARVSLDVAQRRLTVRAGNEAAPLVNLDTAGGLLELRWIELSIALLDSDADGVLDAPAGVEPVQATGRVRWPGAAQLGFGAAVEFEIRYASGRFTLQLPQPIDWPTQEPVVRLGAGSQLSARFYPDLDPMELELALSGAAGVAPGGSAQQLLDKATAVLGQLIGGAGAIPTMQKFALRQRFTLPDAGGIAARTPRWDATRLRFGLSLGLGSNSTPASNSFLDSLPVSISFGDAAFDLPIGPTPLGDWQMRLADVQIGFPEVQGLELGALRGDLLVETFDALDPGALSLAFEPAPIQPLDLPAALRFLLARLRWLVTALPLDDLAEQAGLSLSEAQWLDFFADALGDTPSQEFLETLVQPALAVLDAEKVFALLLRAIGQLDSSLDPEGWTAAAWRAWFAVGTPALPAGTDWNAALARLLQRLFDLAPQVAPRLAASLFAQAAVLLPQPGALFTALLAQAPAMPQSRLPEFAALCARLVAIAAHHLPAGDLPGHVAAALLDLMRPSLRPAGLELPAPPLSLPTGLVGESTQLPLADWLVGRVLAGLAMGPLQLSPTAGWDRIPGLGGASVDALSGMVPDLAAAGSNIIAMFKGLFAAMHLPNLQDPDDRASIFQSINESGEVPHRGHRIRRPFGRVQRWL